MEKREKRRQIEELETDASCLKPLPRFLPLPPPSFESLVRVVAVVIPELLFVKKNEGKKKKHTNYILGLIVFVSGVGNKEKHF